MDAKYTPGPWEAAIYGFSHDGIHGQQGFMICSKGKSMEIVMGIAPNDYVCEITQINSHHEADACIIAAAPELLESLKHIVEYFDKHTSAIDPQWNPEDDAALMEARAIIAKAEGKA